jgi:L-ascorbate metabolism protein UlaG (beta-lactamase superfamily)
MSFHTKLQFLSHATFKITSPEGKIIILDPWLIDNPYLPIDLCEQPVIDVMMLTHGHEDHMDMKIIDIIHQTQPKIIANNLCRRYLIENGIPISTFEPMNLGGTITVMDIKITMVNALHHAHIQLNDIVISTPHASNGFVLKFSDGQTIYFAGDTCVFGDMRLIGEIYKPNIAVIPIGNRSMMSPLEASYAVDLIGAKHIIPFHYGTSTEHTLTPDEFLSFMDNKKQYTVHLLNAGEFMNSDIVY